MFWRDHLPLSPTLDFHYATAKIGGAIGAEYYRQIVDANLYRRDVTVL